MQANADTLINLLKVASQLVIPIFQRPYAWTEEQVATLWKDVLETGSPGGKPTHFLGSVVHVDDTPGMLTKPSQSLVIDGQQRVATVMLLIEAIARSLGDAKPAEGLSDLALRMFYLLNLSEDGDNRFKLRLSRQDDETLRAILNRVPLPAVPSEAVARNLSGSRTASGPTRRSPCGSGRASRGS